jgi:GAF domain-containing protein
MIRRLFAPPLFESDDENFRSWFINGTAWIILLLLAVSMIPQLLKSTPDMTIVVLPALMAVMVVSLYLLHRRYLTLSGLLIVVLTWIGVTFQAFTAEGVKDVIVIAYIAIALLTSLVINWRSGLLVIIISIVTIIMLGYLQERGFIRPPFQPPLSYARDLSIIFTIIATLIYFSTKSLRDAVRRASTSEESLRASNMELQELNQSLEERVSSRTGELELANQRNEKRARQFEAIAQVARATTSAMKLQDLLPRLVQVISQQFGFYHAGIFLLDEDKEFAILSAANSPGGQRMLLRGHRLAVGQTGLVGFVAATGTPRIALDVGDDAIFFDNPDLPETRSELALPLRAGREIIGVLDVQSKESNAFQSEDIEVLSTLADQVTIAIQNARAFETTQQLLSEAQKTSGVYLQDSWKVLQSQETHTGYQVIANTLKRLSERITSPQIHQALASKVTIAESGEKPILTVPIRLRNDVIGVINIRLLEEQEIDPDDIDITEAVAERLSLAIETALLLKTTQRRADIERMTSEISGKISSTTQFESILRTAAEELSRALGGSEVIVQLQSAESVEPSSESSMV